MSDTRLSIPSIAYNQQFAQSMSDYSKCPGQSSLLRILRLSVRRDDKHDSEFFPILLRSDVLGLFAIFCATPAQVSSLAVCGIRFDLEERLGGHLHQDDNEFL